MAEIWPGGGKLQSEMYGIRLPNIRNLRISGDYTETSRLRGVTGYQVKHGPFICVNDGICVYVSPDAEPDYQVIAIYPNRFLAVEIEKI